MNNSEQAIALVQYLRKEGVSFWPTEDGNIRVHPAGLLAPEHRALLKAHKPAVVAWLCQYAADILPDDATLRQWQSKARGSGPSVPVPPPPPVHQFSDNEVTTQPPRLADGSGRPTFRRNGPGGPKGDNMAKIISAISSEPVPAGPHHAVLSRVEDLGLQPGFEDGDEPRWQYAVMVEFPDEQDADERPHTLWFTCTASLHEKSKLGQLARAAGIRVVGKIDPATWVGANFTAMVENQVKNDRTYSKLVGFGPVLKGAAEFTPQCASEPMPEWLRRKSDARLSEDQSKAA